MKLIRAFAFFAGGLIFYLALELKIASWAISNNWISIRTQQTLRSEVEIFLITVLIYPTIEELIFRLPLKITKLTVTTSLIASVLYFGFLNKLLWLPQFEISSFDITKIAITITVLLIFFWVHRKLAGDDIGTRILQIVMVFVMSSLFAVIHLEKIKYDNWIHGILFMAVAHLIPALFLSYIRIKFSLIAAIALHALINSFPYLLFLYFSFSRR
jgi:hypothetical protein